MPAELTAQVQKYKAALEHMSQELLDCQALLAEKTEEAQTLAAVNAELARENAELQERNGDLQEKLQVLRRKMLMNVSHTLNSLADRESCGS